MSAKTIHDAFDAAFPQLFADIAVPKSPFDDDQHAPFVALNDSDVAAVKSARLELERNQRRRNGADTAEEAA